MKKFFVLLLGVFFIFASCDDSDDNKNNSNNENNKFVSLDTNDILAACLIRDACGILPLGYMSQCVTSHYNQIAFERQQPIWNEVYRCVLKSGGNCEEVKKCFGNGEIPQSCDPATEKGFCNGTVMYSCDAFSRTMYAYDCAPANETCVVSDEGIPHCTPFACDISTYQAECDGNVKPICENGYINITDCSVLDLFCQKITKQDGSTQLTCMGDGGSCDPEEFEERCDGNVKVTCEMGVVTSVDCSVLPINKKCELSSTDNKARCLPAGTECEEGEEYCEGDYIAKVCIDGTFYTQNCSELGFTRCTGSGAQHNIGAHCTK